MQAAIPIPGSAATALSGQHSMAMLAPDHTNQLSTYNRKTGQKTVGVPRGACVSLGEVEGAGVVQSLWLTFPGWFWGHWDEEAPVSATILKNLILRLYWDGADAPAVEMPVGDFFGNGLCMVSNFASSYIGMSSGGFFSRFPMPFREGFRVEVENRDEVVDTGVYANVLYQATSEIPEEAGYFHARFSTGVTDGDRPVVLAGAEGTGHYAGCTLSMQCRARNRLAFLEAPEHVFIDGDWDQPRFTGTGLEDYFMGGWYFREGAFVGPLHGVPHRDPFDSSIAMYRIHERDAIRFSERFRMEFRHPWGRDADRPVAWSSSACYYLDRPEGDGAPLPGADDMLPWFRMHDRDHWSAV